MARWKEPHPFALHGALHDPGRRLRPPAAECASAGSRPSPSIRSARTPGPARCRPVPPPRHEQALGQLGEREDRFVGEIARAFQARDRRNGRPAPVAITARRNASVRPSTSRASLPVNRPSPKEHVHTELTEPSGAVDPADPCPEPAHALHHLREITGADDARAAESRPASAAACHARAALSTALDGTHPTLRQSPPIRCRSTSATRAPRPAAIDARHQPARAARRRPRGGIARGAEGSPSQCGRTLATSCWLYWSNGSTRSLGRSIRPRHRRASVASPARGGRCGSPRCATAIVAASPSASTT